MAVRHIASIEARISDLERAAAHDPAAYAAAFVLLADLWSHLVNVGAMYGNFSGHGGSSIGPPCREYADWMAEVDDLKKAMIRRVYDD